MARDTVWFSLFFSSPRMRGFLSLLVPAEFPYADKGGSGHIGMEDGVFVKQSRSQQPVF